ncbi:MAG: Rv3235 family protein [Candidatus Nanopelagicales bacterium]
MPSTISARPRPQAGHPCVPPQVRPPERPPGTQRPAPSPLARWSGQLGDAALATITGNRPALLRAMASTDAIAELLLTLPPGARPERIRRVIVRDSAGDESEVVILLENARRGWALTARVRKHADSFLASSLRLL